MFQCAFNYQLGILSPARISLELGLNTPHHLYHRKSREVAGTPWQELSAHSGNTKWEEQHTRMVLSPYLSHVLHDEAVLADLFQCADAPATSIIRAEDTEVIADALLYHTVGAVIATAATGVALIDGLPSSQPHLALVIVGKLVQ